MSERRAPVQRSGRLNKPSGSVSWYEHEKAWRAYARTFGSQQDAEHVAARGGFSYGELVDFLGHEPETWSQLLVRWG